MRKLNKNKSLTIKLEEELLAKFHKFAKEKGVSMSGLIRMSVIEKMKQEGSK